jgi:hypothetical protein
VEAEQNFEPPLVVDGEAPEAREPSQRALDHPPVATQALGALDTSAGDAGLDAPRAAGTTAPIVVVPFVGVQLGGTLAGPSGALPDRRHGVEQRLEEPAVVDVRGAEEQRERDAAGVDDHVALGARLAAVGRVRTGQLAPLWRGRRRCRASSGTSRPRSPGPSRLSSARWSRSKTPAFCQSRSLRQQVIPDRERRSRSAHLLGQARPGNAGAQHEDDAPRTLRSSRCGPPPFGRRARSGSRGAISAQSASGTNGSVIRPA